MVLYIPGLNSLINASRKGHQHVVRHLLGHKANIEAKSKKGMGLSFSTAVPSGLHALHGRACVVNVMKFFLGWTSLIHASNEDHLSMVKHLLEHKANIEAKDKNGTFLNYSTSILSGWWPHAFQCVDIRG